MTSKQVGFSVIDLGDACDTECEMTNVKVSNVSSARIVTGNHSILGDICITYLAIGDPIIFPFASRLT